MTRAEYVTSVRVIRRWWNGIESEVLVSRATADMFITGVLRVSSIDEPDREPPLELFQPHQWRCVSVYGPDGHEIFGFENPALTAQIPHHPIPSAPLTESRS